MDIYRFTGHILLVEDNEINRLVAGDMLTEMGLTFDTALNGREAVEMITGPVKYRLILMDIQMPIMDGYQATTEIRRLGYSEIPICALTANALQHERKEADAAGIDDYITKPIEWDEFQATLKKYLPLKIEK